jgi:hypothetical protein
MPPAPRPNRRERTRTLPHAERRHMHLEARGGANAVPTCASHSVTDPRSNISGHVRRTTATQPPGLRTVNMGDAGSTLRASPCRSDAGARSVVWRVDRLPRSAWITSLGTRGWPPSERVGRLPRSNCIAFLEARGSRPLERVNRLPRSAWIGPLNRVDFVVVVVVYYCSA